eukprot:9537069-Alexandrium_andersonii.AAC.1
MRTINKTTAWAHLRVRHPPAPLANVKPVALRRVPRAPLHRMVPGANGAVNPPHRDTLDEGIGTFGRPDGAT